jgi:thiamine-phosphate pyrophosphorylase
MFPRATRVYPITDVRLTGLPHVEQVRLLIKGGATLIQLREKQLSPREFYNQAKEALTLARQHQVQIVINDRVDIALALKADGVHLGQYDMTPEAARVLLGQQVLIGYSTHNSKQAVDALKMPVDYIAIGPIFATSSKSDSEPVLGLDGLREVCQTAGNVPVVAIGGISEENAPEVFRAGADCIAVIGAVLGNPSEIADKARRLISQNQKPQS